jgi:hypothetical protein
MQNSLDVREWLQANPPPTCEGANISQPLRLSRGWTKTGGADTAQYSHGDFSGLAALQIPPVPLDLNNGIESFVPKGEGVKAGIEILIRESFATGAPLGKCDILSFRNNLNKI